jgi:hypothetical protein
MLGYLALAQPSVPGIITSITGIVTTIGVVIAAVVGIYQIKKLREDTNSKLEVIHTLVNSTLTASIESDLAATQQGLRTMKALVTELSNDGRPVPAELRTAMAESQAKIDTLTQKMADRLHSAEEVLAQRSGHGTVNPVT